MGSQLAPADAFYSVPVGMPTETEINRAREALARLQLGVPGTGGIVNTCLAEKAGLAGDHGPAFRAIWMALGKANSVATESSEDSSLSEWERAGCPIQ